VRTRRRGDSVLARAVVAALLLSTALALSDVGDPSPAEATPNVSTVLDANIATCEDDPVLEEPGVGLLRDGTPPLPSAAGLDDAASLPGTDASWLGDPDLARQCNGHIASLDSGTFRVEFSVNPDPADDDPTDADPPPVVNVDFRIEVTNAQLIGALDPACTGAGSSAPTFDPVTKTSTVRCVVSGPVPVGTAAGQVYQYVALSEPDGTPIDIAASVSAEQQQPGDGTVLEDPAPDSDSAQVVIDSIEPPLNISKTTRFAGLDWAQRFDDDADGTWDRVWVYYPVGVGPDLLEAHQLFGAGGKGIAPMSLSGFESVDDVSRGGLYPSATLVGCQQLRLNGWGSGEYGYGIGAEIPTCTQSGGAGTPVTITLPDGDRAQPSDCPSQNTATDTTWCPGETPTTTQNRYREFAVGDMVVEYDAAELLAYDQTVNDLPAPAINGISYTSPNVVGVCNTADPDEIVNDGQLADNQTDDQTACYPISLAPAVPSYSTNKGYFGGNQYQGTTLRDSLLFNGYMGDAAAAARIPGFGSSLTQSEDRVLAGQQVFSSVTMTLGNTVPSVQTAGDPFICDVWDPARTPLQALDGELAGSQSVRDHAAVSVTGTGVGSLTADDFVVEFAVAPNTYDPANPSSDPVDCGDESLGWTTDATALPGGAAAANVMRLSSTVSFGPDVTVRAGFRQQIEPSLVAGAAVTNYQRSSFRGGAWSAAPTVDLETAPCPSAWFGNSPCQGVWDRAVVVEADAFVVIDDQGETPELLNPTAWISSGDPKIPDSITTVLPENTWTVDVRPFTLAAGEGVVVENTRVTVVVPPFLDLVSGDMAPAAVYQDCIMARDNDCTSGSAATDAGWTSLVFDLGDLPAPAAGTSALDPFALTFRVSPLIPNNANRTLVAWATDGDEPGHSNGFNRLLANTRTIGIAGSTDYDGRSMVIGNVMADTTSAFTPNSQLAVIDKQSLDPVIPTDDQLTHRLGFAQRAGGFRDFDAIDVFPHLGDGRLTNDPEVSGSPASSTFSGSLELTGISVVMGTAVGFDDIYVSSTDPATIERDPLDADAAGQTIGSATWPCTYADVLAGGVAGCPDLDQVTAIRIVVGDPSVNGDGLPNEDPQLLDLTFQSSGNEPLDVYNNNGTGRVQGLDELYIQSRVATTKVLCSAVGDLLYVDVDEDGVYTEGTDTPVEGVNVEVWSAGPDGEVGGGDDVLATTSLTGEDGRWHSGCLPEGDYFVRIPSAQLSGRYLAVAPDGNPDPTDGADEDQDHNALDDGDGGVVTGVFSLGVGTAPTGEPDPTGYLESTDPHLRDQDVDFTIDLALLQLPAPEIEVQKEICTPGGGCDPDAAPEEDGWAESAAVPHGTNATWRIVVTNTGAVDLIDVTVQDDEAPDCDTAVGELAVGESQTIICESSNVTEGFVNTAEVEGTPPSGPPVTDDDPAEVEVGFDPAIEIRKQVEDEQGSGTFIEADSTDGLAGRYLPNQATTFRIVVTNTGDTELRNVTVTDPLAFGCNNVVGTLAPGASVTYTCTVAAGYGEDITNVADVTGTPYGPGGQPIGDPVTDDDPADVDVIRPDIEVQKQVETTNGSGTFDEQGLYVPGQPVTWRITVTNTGDVDLVDVRVEDDLAASCEQLVGDLAVGASTTYDCLVASGYDADTTNVATATGQPPVGPRVTDDDPAEVEVVEPAITIEKQVEDEQGSGDFGEVGTYVPDQDVTWRITVTNTGEVDLTDVTVTDPLAAECADTIGDLAVGESVTYDCTVPDGYDTDTTNTATVTGQSPVGPLVVDDDPAEVELIEPGISIQKLVESEHGAGTFIEADGTDGLTGTYLAGQAVTWRILVTNTGDVDLASVNATDTVAPSCANAVGALPAGESATYTCTSAGGFDADTTNTATVTGQPPAGPPVDDDDPASIRVVQPGISVDKTVETTNGSGTYAETGTYLAGQPVTWRIAVTNTGDVALTNVVVTDPQAPACTTTIGTLAAGATAAYDCTVVSGHGSDTTNVATATGQPPIGPPVEDADDADIDIVEPAIDVQKLVEDEQGSGDFIEADSTDDLAGSYRAGEAVTWRITVTNTGELDLTDVAVTDPLAAECAESIGALAIGESVTYDCTVASGYGSDSTNLAAAAGQPVDDAGDPVGPPTVDDDPAQIEIVNPSLDVQKQVETERGAGTFIEADGTDGLTGTYRAGQAVTWRIVVTNSGDTPLSSVTISDAIAPSCSNVVGTLAPGASVSYTCTTSAGFADDTTNVATATGRPPSGPDVSDTDPASIEVINPGLDVAKAVETTSGSGTYAETGTYLEGQPVTWRITVTNTGDVTLTNVNITDPQAPSCATTIGTLAAGDSTTYTCTVADGYESDTTNVATATGQPPIGPPVEDADDADIDIVEPGITVQKLVEDELGSGTYAETGTYLEGQAVTWRITVTNTGELDLTDVTVTDLLAAECTDTIGELAVGESVTYDCNVASGYGADTTNLAVVTGQPVDDAGDPVGPPVDDDDPAQIEVIDPAIDVAKTVETSAGAGTYGETGTYLDGQPVIWRITVTNTGDVTLTNVNVTDPAAPSCANTVGTLAAGDSTTYTCTVSAGYDADTTNIATAEGQPAIGPPVTDDDPASIEVIDPGLDVAKTVETTSGSGTYAETGTYLEGQPVTWRITVTNTGDVTLTNVNITDPQAPSCNTAIGTLAAGDSTSYTCTVADGYESDTTNVATATGQPPVGPPVEDDDDAEVDIVDPAIDVQKQVQTSDDSGTFDESGTYLAGQAVTWRITVTNSGELDLTDVVVTDPLAAECADSIGDLAVGESVTYDCTVEDGYGSDTTNVAAAAGQPVDDAGDPVGPPVEGDDPAQIEIVNPSIDVAKTVESSAGAVTYTETGTYLAGQAVTWRIVVTNTGDVTLTNVNVTDPQAAACNNIIGTLAPGASVTYTCTVVSGYESDTTNVAVAAGQPVDDAGDLVGPPVEGDDPASIEVIDPGLAVDKQVQTSHGSGTFDETGTYVAGQAVTWRIIVTNTGDVTLTNVRVTDPKATGCNTTIGTLGAGESVTYSCTVPGGYDTDTTNVATATGQPPVGPPVEGDDSAEIDIVEPGIDLQKLVESTPGSDTYIEADATDGRWALASPGETIRFRIVVENTGDVALDDVVIDDAFAPGCSSDLGRLAPGETQSYDCELTDGSTVDFVNTATVTGTPPGSPGVPTVTDDDPAEVRLYHPTDLALEKSVHTPAAEGNEATWLIRITNRGPAMAYAGWTVVDQLPTSVRYVRAAGPLDCAADGQKVECTSNDDLPVGQSVELRITAMVLDDSAAIENDAAVASTMQDDTEPNNDTDVAQFTIDDVPDDASPGAAADTDGSSGSGGVSGGSGSGGGSGTDGYTRLAYTGLTISGLLYLAAGLIGVGWALLHRRRPGSGSGSVPEPGTAPTTITTDTTDAR
jgi:uncharacterized repeat protein (TIGR01451 family)